MPVMQTRSRTVPCSKQRTMGTPDYLYAAKQARELLGIEAIAAERGLAVQTLRSMIDADFRDRNDDSLYVKCVDRGDVILAERAGLPTSVVEEWLSDATEYVGAESCPPALVHVLKSEFSELLG